VRLADVTDAPDEQWSIDQILNPEMYQTMESESGRSAAPGSVPAKPRESLIKRELADFGFLVATFFVALCGFIVTTTLFWLGVGTIPITVGLAVLILSLSVSGGFARFHRKLLASRGVHISQPVYPHQTGRGGRLRRLGHAQSWRDLLHGFIVFVISTVTFPIGLTWLVTGPGGLLYGIWSRWLPQPNEGSGLAELLGFPGRTADIVSVMIGGAFFLVTAPFMMRGMVILHAGIARGLLDDVASQLREQVSQLATSRKAAGEAETLTLRKFERDLHDGPQQRLVRLGMDISAAQRRMDTDPDQARSMLQSAFDQSQDALTEIRTLSRGIAPPILADQGLSAAITALAARSTVPTSVDIDEVQLSDAAQNAAYFVTAESLANMAKHSQAAGCSVQLRELGAVAVLTITDDGVGGASMSKGNGIAGLADRLNGVDGTLTVSSPPGGPTHITATIPLDPDRSH
jgi:signal transduction histidine kinase